MSLQKTGNHSSNDSGTFQRTRTLNHITVTFTKLTTNILITCLVTSAL